VSTDGRSDEWTINETGRSVPLAAVHAFLTESYWARGIDADTVARSIRHSRPFTLYHRGSLAGFARVVTDCATFAYLADVFVLPEFRGRGLAKWLVYTVLEHPEFAGVRGWYLKTRDAHGLYRRQGFEPLSNPELFMWRPGVAAERAHERPPNVTPPSP
jgi:GNAT superfamily N-acetyltransferase